MAERPVVILQDDRLDATDSITICAFTTDSTEAPLFRIAIQPSQRNGLDATSRIMVDTINTVRKSRLGVLVGQLDAEDLVRLNQAVLVFLGFTTSPTSRSPK